MTLTDKIRSQNVPAVLARAVANRDLGDRAWAFVEGALGRDRRAARAVDRGVPVDGVRFLTEPGAGRDAERFFAEHPIPQSALQLRRSLERQRVNAAFRARATPELMAAFASGADL